MSIECQICHTIFQNNLAGQLTSHLRMVHVCSLEQYIVQTEFGSVAPVCVCGLCDERPVFYRGKFKRYALGHDLFDKRVELYVLKHGNPTCATCGEIVGFQRGQPKKYCSFVCQGKQNGFSKASTQERIQEVVRQKYGVDNVSKLPEVQQAISRSNTGRVVVVSEETKAKHSVNSKKRWADPAIRSKMAAAIKKATNTPTERLRRSEFAILQMNDEEHIKMFFGSGFGCLSKLHQRLKAQLGLELLGFASEQRIGKFIADELNKEKNIVIEINGDYIHANPKKYKATDVIRIPGESYTAQEKWNRDKRKIDYLQEKGYQIHVIWESDDMEVWKQTLNYRQTKKKIWL